MIKSFYLRLFFLGLPGMYLALWLSRFSLSMVNGMPYYYGMIMTAVSIFCGMLTGFIMYKPFSNYFRKNCIVLMLAEFIFLFAGHIFDWMDAGIYTKYEIIYYFAGLSIIGFSGSIGSQIAEKRERNVLLGAFLFGSVLSYFIGVQYFEQSYPDIFLGIPVFLILVIDQFIFCREKSVPGKLAVILLGLIASLMAFTTYFKTSHSGVHLTSLGYTKTVKQKNDTDIYDHKRRFFEAVKSKSTQNIADMLVYQLQTNQKQMDVLFVGYPGSITPLFSMKSPFVKKTDLYFWDFFTPKGYLHATVSSSIFYRSQWDMFKLFKNRKYDLIVIENMPEESASSRRIFLHYAKKLLKSPHGVIAYPEIIARKYDGSYMKASASSSLVMLNGSESTDNSAILEKRYAGFVSEITNIPSSMFSKQNIPEKMITEFNSETSTAPHADIKIQTIFPPRIMHIALCIFFGIYLIFRLFKCRFKNNQNKFFAFESGFTFSIIIFSCLMLLSELRLVYPYFSPALFGISVLLMMPCGGRKTNFVLQTALLLTLLYLTSANFVRTFQPIYVLFILLPPAFLGTAKTLENCQTGKYRENTQLQIAFSVGVIFTLLILIFAKNNNLYPTLIYAAIISRLLYYFKI